MAKAASSAVPPLLWNSFVQRLTQHFEHLSLRSASYSTEGGSLLDDPTGEASQIQLNHEEISWEYYSGHVFTTLEMVPVIERHHGTTLQMRAIGSQFNWTLNQEVVFSAALTDKPKKKLYFSQYCWRRCVIGTKHDYAPALSRPEWQYALSHGDLPSLQEEDCNDPLIFSPANNTEFLDVAAYLEAFWGYIWPTASHNNVPPHDEWKTIKHGGLKEFVDHVVSTFGRAQLKPTTECLRGVTTYPSGDQRQGRYNMTLTDLMNNHYTRAVREASLDLILGRSDNIVKVGDLVEMLLGISFAVKDAMHDWEWLGIDAVEWPPQRLDWEMYRIEHLSFVSNIEAQFAGWLQYPWHILYSALRCMACQSWQSQHLCPICRNAHRNSGGTHDARAYFNGCLTHLSTAPRCIGSFMLEDTLKGCGRPTTSPVIALLKRLSPKQEAREWLPAVSIIYMAPGGHRQWPMSITALLERLSWIVLQTRPLALTCFQQAVQRDPKWEVDERLPLHQQLHLSFLTSELRWDATSLENMFPKSMTLTTSIIQDSSEMQFHLSTPFMLLFMVEQRDGSMMWMNGVSKRHGLNTLLPLTSESLTLQETFGDCLC